MYHLHVVQIRTAELLTDVQHVLVCPTIWAGLQTVVQNALSMLNALAIWHAKENVVEILVKVPVDLKLHVLL